MGKYRDEARKEARKIAEAQPIFGEIMAEILKEKGTTDKVHLTDYPSGDYMLGDKNYSPKEAIDVIEELSEYEEEDSAYWAGRGVLQAVQIVGGLTFRNAVHHYFTSVIDQINDDVGNMEIPWTLNDRYRIEMEEMRGKGVLEWDPTMVPPDQLPAKTREKLEKQHEKRLHQELSTLIREAIKNV